jgi:hypothetical protein
MPHSSIMQQAKAFKNQRFLNGLGNRRFPKSLLISNSKRFLIGVIING